MRILYLGTDVFAKGGIPRYSMYQIKALRELTGTENVHVFSLAGFNATNAFEERIKTDYVQGGSSFFHKLIFTLKALSFIKKKNIELVIVNHIQLSIIAHYAKKLFGTKYFTNVYGIEVWTNIKQRDITGLKNSDVIIGDCNFVLSYVKKHFGIVDAKLALLHDPVDTNKFKPQEKDFKLFEKYAVPKNKFVVMTVGRLERNKGFELMMKTLKAMPEEIIYVIVGDGSMREFLFNLRKNLGLEQRVFFTLRVPEDELVPLYNLGDVLILISSFGHGEGEGLPLGLIEASACGKPIICGNEDGSVDAVDEGVNGFIISSDDEEALKDRIRSLYNDEELRKRMGKGGIEKVNRDFKFEHFKSAQQKILEKIFTTETRRFRGEI